MRQRCVSAREVQELAPVIELRAPAECTQLATIRGVSATLAGQCNLSADKIADLRLAVDQACRTLFRIALAGSDIVCRFQMSAVSFQFSADVTTVGWEVDRPYERRFGWHVLRTLTDDLELHRYHHNGDVRSSSVSIAFTMSSGDMS